MMLRPYQLPVYRIDYSNNLAMQAVIKHANDPAIIALMPN